jgi:hypothetical protein
MTNDDGKRSILLEHIDPVIYDHYKVTVPIPNPAFQPAIERRTI